MKKSFAVYVAALALSGVGIFAVLRQAPRVEAGRAFSPAARHATAPEEPPEGGAWLARLRAPLPRLLLQFLTVLLASRLCGILFRRLGQPPVIGEIVAGIALGPSLLGAAAPRLSAFLFAPTSLGILKLFAEIGVLLFLFVVGLELDPAELRGRAHAAVVVSHASILAPYFLGVLLALLLYRDLAPEGARFVPFALFLGIAMSITAFPVLARILEERSLTHTPLGRVAITCAAVDDVTAWALLAVVVAASGAASLGAAAGTVALTVLFVAGMLFAVGPLLRRVLAAQARKEEPGPGAITVVLIFLLASALATEWIGIHALFGAFLAGFVLPRESRFRRYLAVRLERFSSVFLVPLFFAFTGLRTEIGLLSGAGAWVICGAIVVVATAGKLGGSALAARMTGLPWGEALSLGALLNTRGLMELIALNLGYELGILSPRIFAMLVLMAVTTTFATGPLLSLVGALRRREPRRVAA